MPPSENKLSSFFEARQTSRSSTSISSSEDAAVRQALQLSEAEAKLANLSEEELLQQAIQASMAEVDKESNIIKRPRIERELGDSDDSINVEKEAKRVKIVDNTGQTRNPFAQTDSGSVTLTKESFSDKEEVINRLNGSLDLLYCKSWIQRPERQQIRDWMLNELAWHRVSYTSNRSKQKIVTPRFTATFGKDDTGAPESVYPVKPKVIPPILARLRDELQTKTGSRFNAIIINFYQDGNDSISYHADDETFLGLLPTIASLSLGSPRDFYLRRKYAENTQPANKGQHYTKGVGPAAARPIEKMKLDDGDLIIMRGKTQAEWEHSIPKRANVGGRINLTFRKVVSVKGTNNFQRYNRGLPTDDDTRTYRWDAKRRIMAPGIGGI